VAPFFIPFYNSNEQTNACRFGYVHSSYSFDTAQQTDNQRNKRTISAGSIHSIYIWPVVGLQQQQTDKRQFGGYIHSSCFGRLTQHNKRTIGGSANNNKQTKAGLATFIPFILYL
jgi:hypothetical protein